MKRPLLIIPVILFCAIPWGCAPRGPLEGDDWNPRVRRALTELIRLEGKDAKGYDPACKPYAVFDYDNTTVMGDIAQTLLAYQIEHRAFAIPPDRFGTVLLETLPDPDADFGRGLTPRSLAADLQRDYALLCRFGEDLEAMRRSDAYRDFRAKLWYFSANTDLLQSDSPFGCIWIATLLDGMTQAEITRLTRSSVEHWLATDGMWREVWTSPDSAVTVRPSKGLSLTPEMRGLYRALRDNGFDVYICSASPEPVVEAMACDPAYGLGLDPEAVLGIRLTTHPDGTLHAVGDSSWTQPYRAGKVACIRREIAPLHAGRGPALVAGDSNGDYAMLTAFGDLRVGLVVNCLGQGGIGGITAAAAGDHPGDVRLKGRTTPLYVVQGRDPAAKRFVPGWQSEPTIVRESESD